MRIISEYSRAGAAAKSQRQNAEIALQQSNQDQAQQSHIDALLGQRQEHALDRAYRSAADTNRTTAEASLIAQRNQYATQQDAVDHQQALELQGGRLEHAQQIQTVKSVDQRVAELQKQLSSARLTPAGKQLAAKQLGQLNAIRAAEAKNMYVGRHAAERDKHLNDWLKRTDALGIENHQVQELTPAQQWEKDKVDIGGGRVSIPIRDTTGKIVRWKIENPNGTTVEDEAKKQKAAAAEYVTNATAARDRLQQAWKSNPNYDGRQKTFTNGEVFDEIARKKAKDATEAADYQAYTAGLSSPAGSTAQTASASSPSFVPNVSPTTDIMSVPPEQMGLPPSAPTAQPTALQQPVAVTPYDSKESRQDGNVMKWLDEQGLAPYTFGATPRDLAVMPQDAFKQFLGMAQARKVAAETQPAQPAAQQAGPTNDSQGIDITPNSDKTQKQAPPSIESAITAGPPVKFPFGDGELSTTQQLQLADGRKLAVAPVEISGKKFRAMHTGGAWRLLHVDEEGLIKPLATLNGPGAGSRGNPVTFHSADADEISTTLPKGVWTRDESGTLYQNK